MKGGEGLSHVPYPDRPVTEDQDLDGPPQSPMGNEKTPELVPAPRRSRRKIVAV